MKRAAAKSDGADDASGAGPVPSHDADTELAWLTRLRVAEGQLFAGDNAKAATAAREGVALIPRSSNALQWLYAMNMATGVLAWAGQEDEAATMLEQLADAIPGVSPAMIARDPIYTVALADNALPRRCQRNSKRRWRRQGWIEGSHSWLVRVPGVCLDVLMRRSERVCQRGFSPASVVRYISRRIAVVVVERLVNAQAVVPQRDHVRLPAQPAGEGRLGDVLGQDIFSSGADSRSFMPSMPIAYDCRQYSAFSPVTGCVRTSGCMLPRTLRSSRRAAARARVAASRRWGCRAARR